MKYVVYRHEDKENAPKEYLNKPPENNHVWEFDSITDAFNESKKSGFLKDGLSFFAIELNSPLGDTTE